MASLFCITFTIVFLLQNKNTAVKSLRRNGFSMFDMKKLTDYTLGVTCQLILAGANTLDTQYRKSESYETASFFNAILNSRGISISLDYSGVILYYIGGV